MSGPSQSGKTRFTQKILNNPGVFSKPIPNIVYANSQWQPAFQEISDNDSSVLFYEGLPTKQDLSEWSQREGGLLLVLDDLVYRVIQSFDYMELFTIHVHHMNISVIFISQNLFPQGKYSRVISLNCQYLVLFKNPRDNFQVKFLATQLYSGQTKYFLDAYEKATQKTLLLFISRPNSQRRQRLCIADGDISRRPFDGVQKTMSARLKRNWAFINLLATASVKQRRALLDINVQQLKTLLEVIYNVIHNRALIPSEHFITTTSQEEDH